jgi:2-polyprenyl-3-methyl-5-hydroxy-6-metoxy-1,4-benzoquinol methylase
MNYEGYFNSNYALLNKNYKKWFWKQNRVISNYFNHSPTESILEIGSGTGGYCEFLPAGIQYTGLELDPRACEYTKNKYPQFSFENSTFENFSSSRKYDVIVAFEVLEHIENPNACIAKISDLLTDGGIFIGTSPFPFKKNIKADSTHISVLHPLNWKRLFELHKLIIITIKPMTFIPVVWRINKRLNILIPFYIPFRGIISTSLLIVRKSISTDTQDKRS